MGVFSARAGHDAADLKQAIEEECPDAVLVDILSWGALAAAEAWGGPSHPSLPSHFAPLPRRAAIRAGTASCPGALGRLRERLLWASYRTSLDPPVLSRLNGSPGIARLDPLRARL